MKRPALMAAAGLICGCLLAAWQVFLWVILAVLTVIVCLTFKVLGKKGSPLILYVIFLLAGYIIMRNSIGIREKTEAIDRDTVITVTGKADNVEEGAYGCRLYIKIEGGYCIANLYDTSFKSLDKDALAEMLGNEIRVTGSKKDFKEAVNQGNFSERAYNYSRGVILKIDIENIEITDHRANEFKVASYKLRKRFNETMSNICTDRLAGVFMAIIYGEKGMVDEEIQGSFSDAGISHILVISGVHISIAGMGVFYLLRRLLSAGHAAAVSSIIMIMYVIIAGGGVSAVRALIMFLINLAGRLTGRIYDMKNAIAIGAIILIVSNPYYIFNTSFLLSFSSVFAIGFVLPCVIEFINTKKSVIKAFITSLTVNIVNGPVIANMYFEISPYSVLLNIIVVPLMSIVVICGLLGLAAGQLSYAAGAVIIYPAVLIINFYELLCRLTIKLPLSRIVTGHFELWQLLLYYGFMAVMVYGMYKITDADKRESAKTYIRAAACGALSIIFSLALYITVPRRNTITFLDVGQGDSSVFVSGDGMVCIFDAGSTSRDNCGSYNILPYLKYSGIAHIDYIILSHSDKDHINGVREIIEDNGVSVGNIIVSSGDKGFDELIKNVGENINIIYGYEGIFIEDKSAKISFLNPAEDLPSAGDTEGDINDRSIAAVIDTNGKKIVMTGDIGKDTEEVLGIKYGNTDKGNNKEILCNIADADILKVAHHGSKHSSSDYFLNIVSPKLAVISCGENNTYGHPHKEALERLSLHADNVKITYKTGAITVYLDNSDTLNYDIFRK